MTGRVILLLLFAVNALTTRSLLRAENNGISVALKASLTTASRVFTDPNSSDAFQRSQFFSLEDFFGYGVEVRYQPPETNVALGLSAEYIETVVSHSISLSTSTSVPVEDGYRVIPLELTGYFIIPISGQAFGVFMGGGVGGYFGKRLYKLGDTEAPTTEEGHGFGIHVLGGLSYRFTEWFSLNAEMKFRDLQFQTTNQFATTTATYKGMPITVSRAPSTARVHTDGVVFQLATVFHF
jgi:opacity protein-like surface antigen